MEIKKIIEKLCEIGERQLEGEVKARKFICSLLKENNIKYSLFSFTTQIPKFIKYSLIVDGQNIECLPTGLVSGIIDNNYNLISSLTSSQNFLYKKNINFNPRCKSISRANFYFAPSLAINKNSLKIICDAQNIKGEIKVEKKIWETASILVGNTTNPKIIIFSHFDSIEIGAIDNASGTAMALIIAIKNKQLLKDILFVFDSNEEISYDKPIYWGHGYREFEKKYYKLIEECEKILIIDCVGYSKYIEYKNKEILKLAFPIFKIDSIINKTCVISGDYDELMKVYQSPIDRPKLIKEEYLKATQNKIMTILKNNDEKVK